MYSVDDDAKAPGCPIQKSTDQRVLSPPRSLSQSATSFIASRCQGIHQMLLICLRTARTTRTSGTEVQPAMRSQKTAFCITRFKRSTYGTQFRDANPGTKLNVIQPSKIPVGLDVGTPKRTSHQRGLVPEGLHRAGHRSKPPS